MTLDDSGAGVNIDLVLQLVKLVGGKINVVQFYKRLYEI